VPGSAGGLSRVRRNGASTTAAYKSRVKRHGRTKQRNGMTSRPRRLRPMGPKPRHFCRENGFPGKPSVYLAPQSNRPDEENECGNVPVFHLVFSEPTVFCFAVRHRRLVPFTVVDGACAIRTAPSSDPSFAFPIPDARATPCAVSRTVSGLIGGPIISWRNQKSRRRMPRFFENFFKRPF